MEEATCTIVQKRFLRGRRTLTLKGSRLTVEYRRGLSCDEYTLDLQGLLPESTRIRYTPAETVIGRILSGVLGLGLVITGIRSHATDDSIITPSVLGAALVASGIGGWMLPAWIPTRRQWMNVVIFQGPGGQVTLWPDLPSKEEFSGFCALLTARIQAAQRPEQMVVRQLLQAGILDDWQYDQAVELFHWEDDGSDHQ